MHTALSRELPEFALIGVATRTSALATFEQVRPHFVVAGHDGARRLLKDLDRLGSDALPVFLCPLADPRAVSELADVAADGHVFHTVDVSAGWSEVAQSLRRLLYLRDSARVSFAEPLLVQFRVDGTPFRLPCVDVANRGIGIRLPVDETVERFSPGTVLSDVEVTREDGSLFLSRPRATVRQATLDSGGGETAFRVGVALRGQEEEDEPGTALTDPVRILALLRRAARRKTSVSGSSSRNVRVCGTVARVPESSDEPLVLRTSGSTFVGVGEVLELSLDFGGEAFRGLTSVLHVAPHALSVALPASLAQVHRRNLLRFHPPPSTPFVISFQSPVDGTLIVRPVLDIHVAGLSFPFDAGREVLPLGLRLDEVSLTLPSGENVRCRAEVRDVQPLPAQHPNGALMLHPFRCGLKLSSVPSRMRAAIVDAAMGVRFPIFRPGHQVPFRDVWALMEEAGQFFPEYPVGGGRHVDRLERVQSALAQSEGELARSYAAFDEGRPRGFVSGLRAYSRTWLTQHLAVAPGYYRSENTSRDLGTLIIEWAESMEDIEYIRYIWRTDNRWPNRVFGWIARTMRRNALTRLAYNNYMVCPPDRTLDAGERLPVREATHGDAVWLEHHLRSAGRLVEMRSDDLTARELNLSTVAARYSRRGLERTRRMYVVDGEKGPLAVALAETSTPGLCWPEFTNAFRVMTTAPEHPRAGAAARSLAEECFHRYRAAGRPLVIGMVSDVEAPELEALGFERLARVADWTFHRSLIRPWHNIFLSVFERLARRERRSESGAQEAA